MAANLMRWLSGRSQFPLVSKDGAVLLRSWSEQDEDFLRLSFDDPSTRDKAPLFLPESLQATKEWIADRSALGHHPVSPAFIITNPQGQRQGAIGATSIDWSRHRLAPAQPPVESVPADPTPSDSGCSAEFYYWVLSPYRGCGIATRALQTISGWAESKGLTRLVLMIDTHNLASIKVAQAAGYQFECLKPGYRFFSGRRIDAERYARCVDPVRLNVTKEDELVKTASWYAPRPHL